MIHFLSGAALPVSAITLDDVVQYNLWLVSMSYILAVFGSFIAIAILKSLHSIKGRTRRIGMVLGAIVMATAIWSMHYTGMLSYNMKMEHNYDPWLTAFSGVVAVLFALGVFYILLQPLFRYRHIILSAPLLGFGVAAMHYTGMMAMQVKGELYYKPSLFLLSIVIAIVASGAALWIMHQVRQLQKHQLLGQFLASLVMGVAVCGMHYYGHGGHCYCSLCGLQF